MLAYGVAGDLVDEYMRMGESTCLESMYKFCEAVVAVFGEEYLREPTVEDTKRMLSINESRGFLGMLGSMIACTGSGRTAPLLGKGSTRGVWHGDT